MVDLSGKVAVITGAASGIGLAGVEVFVAAGAKVVAGDIQDEKGKALEARFGADTVSYVHCDVTSMDDLKNMMQHAADQFGGLDVLWNNAGSGGTPTGVEDLDLDGYDFTMDLLLKQVFAATHFAIPHMKARGGGSVDQHLLNQRRMRGLCPDHLCGRQKRRGIFLQARRRRADAPGHPGERDPAGLYRDIDFRHLARHAARAG